MAEYLVANGRNKDVRAMAQSMIKGQTSEIAEMEKVLGDLPSP